MNDYLYDKGSEDSSDDLDVAKLEDVLGRLGHRAPLRQPLPKRADSRGSSTKIVAIALTLAAAAALIVTVAWPRGDAPLSDDALAEHQAGKGPAVTPAAVPSCDGGAAGFSFATRGGAATCDGDTTDAGVLPVGAWLETAADVSAELAVADIGELTVHGDSRLRLVETGANQHRLELARGRIEAVVTAPPRLFVIDTPAASAVDLGCAYELQVDARDRTRLHVTLGAVSLEHDRHSAWVPMGYEVVAVPGRGPGIPVRSDADAQWRNMLSAVESGDLGNLGALAERAGEADLGTLWNLLAWLDAKTEREQIIARLDQLRPLPGHISQSSIVAGDPSALEAWRVHLESELFED